MTDAHVRFGLCASCRKSRSDPGLAAGLANLLGSDSSGIGWSVAGKNGRQDQWPYPPLQRLEAAEQRAYTAVMGECHKFQQLSIDGKVKVNLMKLKSVAPQAVSAAAASGGCSTARLLGENA